MSTKANVPSGLRIPPQQQQQISEEQAERQLNQLVSELRLLEQYYSEISTRLQAASAGLSDIRSAILAVDGLAKNQKSDMLVPIGGGLLLPIGSVEAKRVVMSVGAGVAIEKDLDSARAYLQAREKELEKAVQALDQQRREIGSRLETGRAVLQQVTGQA